MSQQSTSQKLVSGAIGAVVIGGAVFFGMAAYQCYQQQGSLGPAEIVLCAGNSISSWIQSGSDKVQCELGGGNLPKFPTSPFTAGRDMFKSAYHGITGKGNFVDEVNRRNLPDCHESNQ